jgi:glycine/D-amino acid oxidase-like deaminating enzyme
MSAPRRPIEDACYWLSRRERRPLTEPLLGVHTADVAIVGAGFTGLWTALHLRALAPSLGIVVLERGSVAHGASGRNAGMLSSTIDHSHGLAIEHFGLEEATRLAAVGRRNVREMTDSLEAHGIDCDLERTGILTAALSDAHLESLEASAEDARAVGLDDWRLLGGDEMRAEIRSPRYHGALLDPGGAILDPVKLTDGLARRAKHLGIACYERTPVLSLDTDSRGVNVRTARGEVRARTCILATSAYTHRLLPHLTFRFVPLYDYVLVSEPLTGAQRAILGWRARQGVNDCRSFFNYYRLTKDDRVLWGTSEALYFSGNRVDDDCDHSEPHYARLRESWAFHFPELADLGFPYAWGGAICATTRFTPFFGRAMGGAVLYGLGFTGHGLGTTHLAGKILAHMALGRPHPVLDLRIVREPPFPYPPEPIRNWAIRKVTRDLRSVDLGESPSLLLRVLDGLGIGLSS